MPKINVKQGDGKAPKALAMAIVENQAFPFTATLTHKAKKPLVVPSTGIAGLIAPGSEGVPVKVKSLEQAWVMVTDLAALAERHGSDANDFAVIETPDVAPAAKAPKVAKNTEAAPADGGNA